MSDFSSTPAFILKDGPTNLKVNVLHDVATTKPVSVSFYDPDRDQMVSVDADLWERVVAAVARAWEF